MPHLFKHLHPYVVISVCLFLCFSLIGVLLAQDETPPAEPPTAELPTSEPPTIEPPTLEPPTALPPPTEPPTPLPPTATHTEIVPSATFTETVTPTSTVLPSFTPDSSPFPTLNLELTEEATDDVQPAFSAFALEDYAALRAQTAGDLTFTVTFDEPAPAYIPARTNTSGGGSTTLVSALETVDNPTSKAARDRFYNPAPPVWSWYGRTTALSVPIDPVCSAITSVTFQYYFHRTRDSGVWAGIFVYPTYGEVIYGAEPAGLAQRQATVGGTSFNQWLTFGLSTSPVHIPVPSGSSIFVHGGMGTRTNNTLLYVFIDNITYTCIPATPTPSPTPTETPTRIPFTDLDLNGEDSALKAVIFWAIFNESVFDVVDSGSAVDDFDLGNTRFSKFLFAYPYCSTGSGLGDNAAEPPPPANPTTQDWYIRHCPHDYRYMAAQTMLNGFLNYERNYGISRVFEYALVNFSGSIGNTNANYPLWNLDPQCATSGDYAYALGQSSAGNSYAPAINWLVSYMDCIGNSTSIGFGIQRAQRAYSDTLLPQIQDAVNDFYATPTDHTDAAFQAKVINFGATRILVTCVGGCYIQDTVGVVYTYESPQDVFLGFATPVASITATDVTFAYGTHLGQISSYIPSYHSVAQPVLIYMYNNGNHVGYVWETEIYQQSADMSHFPR